MLFVKERETNPDGNLLVRSVRRFFPASPMFAALVAIEVSDLIFAVDSIPAIFAITSDPFIVFTSNVFAMLGLRSLYFALAGMINRFHYLKPALAVVLLVVAF
jgi:tellurite resistance protein TerC